MAAGDFYLRYYVGHHGKFGHEFLEFEFRPDGKSFGGLQIPCNKKDGRYVREPRGTSWNTTSTGLLLSKMVSVTPYCAILTQASFGTPTTPTTRRIA